MSEITFNIKVTAIHPAYDSQGNEYVCIEFGYKPPQVPTMIPTNVPREVSDMIQASKDVVKVVLPPQLQAQWRTYANRLALYLTVFEWEKLKHKYTVSDEFTVTLKNDGSIIAEKL